MLLVAFKKFNFYDIEAWLLKNGGYKLLKGEKILSEYWESFSANNLTWKFWKKIQKKIEFCGI